MLSSGIWYRAEAKFIKGVQASLDSIEPCDILIPPWDGECHEDTYNASCCRSGSGMVLFDKKIVHYGGGQSKFEFCDFMHPKKRTLFFAKIPSKSSDCSHLVEQTKRTIELFFGVDGTFRKKLKASIAGKKPVIDTSWLDSRPRPGDWKLCLVLMGKKKDALPLFARCSVSRLAKHCEERGHPLLLASV